MASLLKLLQVTVWILKVMVDTGITNREIAIVIEYKATRSVILLINEKSSGVFIEMLSRKPKSIPPVVVSKALSLSLTIVS